MRPQSLFIALLLCSCSSAAVGPQIGYTLDVQEPEAPRAVSRPAKREVPADIVERSRQPLSGLRNFDDKKLTEAELFDDLARADVVCIGESHDDPEHHFAQVAIVEGMLLRAPRAGRALSIGFEMFQRPFQAVLDQYASGRIDEAELLEQTEYEERWGYPYAYYRPLVRLAHSAGVRLVALNAPRELSRKVARGGLKSLDPRERSRLPALDMSDVDHRTGFEAMMSDHPKGHGTLENYYEAQVLWDETMADAAADFVEQRAPARQLVVIAGQAHCRHSAIPARIERRLRSAKVRSVLPVKAGEQANLRALGYDYAVVLEGSGRN